jgi:hypothetical protein
MVANLETKTKSDFEERMNDEMARTVAETIAQYAQTERIYWRTEIKPVPIALLPNGSDSSRNVNGWYEIYGLHSDRDSPKLLATCTPFDNRRVFLSLEDPQLEDDHYVNNFVAASRGTITTDVLDFYEGLDIPVGESKRELEALRTHVPALTL